MLSEAKKYNIGKFFTEKAFSVSFTSSVSTRNLMVLLSILSNAEFTGTNRVYWAPNAFNSAAIPEDWKYKIEH